jgi:hypothetical protein
MLRVARRFSIHPAPSNSPRAFALLLNAERLLDGRDNQRKLDEFPSILQQPFFLMGNRP